MIEKINLHEKFGCFQEYWQPKIAGELNDSFVKLVKFKGKFVWHNHEVEDELFWVVKGRMTIKFRDGDLTLSEGELVIVPKGIEHMPAVKEEVWVALLEPKSTLNTGNVKNERTLEYLERI